VTFASVEGSGSGHTIKEAGAGLTQRAGLNFLAGFDLTDDAVGDETEVALDLSEVAGGGDITWTGNTPAVDADSHGHTTATVTTHSTAHAHADTTGQTANDHHNQAHAVDGASDHSAATQGDIPYAGAAGAWTLLAAGDSGKYLKTQGAGANPMWDTPAGGGDNSAARFRLAGRYHFLNGVIGGSATTSVAANYLYAVPFYAAAAKTVIAMILEVTTLGAGSSRLGIYTDDGSLYPGTRLLDAGTIDVSSTGFKEITALNQALAANTLYWLVCVSNVTHVVRGYTAAWLPHGFPNTTVTAMSVYRVAFTYAALPTPFPVSATPSTQNVLAIGVSF